MLADHGAGTLQVGTPNPDVRLRVVDLEKVAKTKKPTLVDIPAPVEVTK